MTAHPCQAPPDFDAIERHLPELVAMPHWVVWRYEDRGEPKLSKVPYSPGTRMARKAASDDARTWRTYEQAKADYLAGGADGVGFQLGGSGYWGFDFDHVVNVGTGEVDAGAEAYAGKLATYTETSPSGTGLRGIGRGQLPPGGRRKRGVFGKDTDFEIYDSGRYLTITGRHLDGYPDRVAESNGALEQLHTLVFGKPKTPTGEASGERLPHVSDEQILQRIRRSRNGPKFESLWAGNTNGHNNDASGADQALCNILAFWCGPDPARIDAMFRQSGLYRPKWDVVHHADGRTYGEGTVAKALEGRTEFHRWPMNPNVAPAPREPQTADYIAALEALGYAFRINEMFDIVEVNGVPISDPLEARINCELRDNGYKNVHIARDAWTAHALSNAYHPIEEYLEGLTWDGRDHIGALAGYFTDTDDLFPLWLRYWLIGAVARIYERNKAGRRGLSTVRTRMLVLAGPQSLGKSYFCRWLGSDMPGYFVDKSINPDEKDCIISTATTWIWEVGELGATTRRADREALKLFLSRTSVRERKSYGRYDTHKAVAANYIGTANPEGGFLADPTGNDRYMVAELTGIYWAYAEEVDVGQVWAQARALYDAGEPWDLPEKDANTARDINERFEIGDVLGDRLDGWFDIDPGEGEWRMTTESILGIVQDAYRVKEIPTSEKDIERRLATELARRGCRVTTMTVGGKRRRGYRGIRERHPATEGTAPIPF